MRLVLLAAILLGIPLHAGAAEPAPPPKPETTTPSGDCGCGVPDSPRGPR